MHTQLNKFPGNVTVKQNTMNSHVKYDLKHNILVTIFFLAFTSIPTS